MQHATRILMLLVVITGALALSLAVFADDEPVEIAYSTESVNVFGTEDMIDSSFATIIRNGDEVAMMLHTTELTPGDVVTTWWVIFNNPENCSDGVCAGDDLPQNGGADDVEAAMILADGQIVDADGNAKFTARLATADNTNAYAFETDGLTDIAGAEIHLVVRTHGPALDDAELLEAQLTSLNGGCENGSETSGLAGPNTCSNVQSSIHISE